MKENKSYFKSQKGITLIALIITIIVLLILAGVSIATLTGENGILTQAGTAKKENKKASVIDLSKNFGFHSAARAGRENLLLRDGS